MSARAAERGRYAHSKTTGKYEPDRLPKEVLSMTRRFLTLFLMVAIGSFAFAQSKPAGAKAQPGSIEQTLRALSDEWSNATIKHDTAVFKRIWAADFVYVEPSGRVFNKEEGIADEAKSTDKVTSAEVSNFIVRVYGGDTVAVTMGDFRQIGRDKDGKPFDRKTRFTNVWVLQKGSWQCVSGHASALPSKP